MATCSTVQHIHTLLNEQLASCSSWSPELVRQKGLSWSDKRVSSQEFSRTKVLNIIPTPIIPNCHSWKCQRQHPKRLTTFGPPLSSHLRILGCTTSLLSMIPFNTSDSSILPPGICEQTHKIRTCWADETTNILNVLYICAIQAQRTILLPNRPRN